MPFTSGGQAGVPRIIQRLTRLPDSSMKQAENGSYLGFATSIIVAQEPS